MSNLLKETIESIKNSGHTSDDIIFIGSAESGHSCTWEDFKILANIEYDSGFGGQEIAKDLIIVFKDGSSMWRGEYDGSEWWEYAKPFKMPETTKRIVTLKGSSLWVTLDELHDTSEADNEN